MPCDNNLNNDEEDVMLLIAAHSCYRSTRRKYQIPIAPYCACDFPRNTTITNYKGPIPDLIKCRCGEDDVPTRTLHWNWHENDATDIIISGQDVTFHPTYSQGTAIVRGQQPLAAGMLHFWEMRMLTALSGTDVMFGIGTDKVELKQFKFHFVSALGSNSQSWGFSYEGKIQHNGVQLTYGQKFSQGCIVGVLLDRTRGQLEFFLNRRSLGVAYTNIPNDPHIKLYPMVCSTAAKSAIRLMNSTSQVECLQLRAFRAMAKQPKALEELRKMPGLKTILHKYWFLSPPVRFSRESRANDYDILDEAVLSSRSRLSRKHKYQDDDDDNVYDINDLYSNAHKIPAHHQSDSDEELHISEYFDEYFHYLS